MLYCSLSRAGAISFSAYTRTKHPVSFLRHCLRHMYCSRYQRAFAHAHLRTRICARAFAHAHLRTRICAHDSWLYYVLRSPRTCLDKHSTRVLKPQRARFVTGRLTSRGTPCTHTGGLFISVHIGVHCTHAFSAYTHTYVQNPVHMTGSSRESLANAMTHASPPSALLAVCCRLASRGAVGIGVATRFPEPFGLRGCGVSSCIVL
jgi:hypothetical protein